MLDHMKNCSLKSKGQGYCLNKIFVLTLFWRAVKASSMCFSWQIEGTQ